MLDAVNVGGGVDDLCFLHFPSAKVSDNVNAAIHVRERKAM